jgi:flagellum-specific peptidoglycan hydrolase FlgJ
MTPEKFADTFGLMAVSAMIQNGGFASVRLGQIALESAWGESTPVDLRTGKHSFNLTGVKGEGPNGSVTAPTMEEIDGKWVMSLADFRAYHNYAEHILERDRIFEWENYDAYRKAETWEDAVDALQSAPEPYATDSHYAEKLKAIIRENGFDRFDGYVFVDVPPDHPFAGELREMRETGVLHGQADGFLNLSMEAIRVLVICKRMVWGDSIK